MIARALGCGQSNLSRWENGEKSLDIFEVENLAALYDLKLTDFHSELKDWTVEQVKGGKFKPSLVDGVPVSFGSVEFQF